MNERKITAMRLADSRFVPFPLPPLPPPHQAHGMVNVWQWRAVGNYHGGNKKKKNKQTNPEGLGEWRMEYSVRLKRLSWF